MTITVTSYSCAPSSGDHLFTCGAIFWPPHMYCDGSITIMWSLNIFINDFPLICRQVKNQSFQDIIRSVFQLSSDVNCHPTRQ